MKRNKSFVATFLGVIVCGWQIIISGWMLFIAYFAFAIALDLSADITSKIITSVTFGLYLLLELLLIATLVLNCIGFSYVNGSTEKYAKRKRILITTIVFNFILVALFVIPLCLQQPNILNYILYIISAVLLVVANILFIVDAKQEEKRKNISEDTLKQ